MKVTLAYRQQGVESECNKDQFCNEIECAWYSQSTTVKILDLISFSHNIGSRLYYFQGVHERNVMDKIKKC